MSVYDYVNMKAFSAYS